MFLCLSQLSDRTVLSLILLLTVLSACALPEGEPAEHITLTFACQRGELTVYQDAAETFHQADPSIQIRIIPLDEIISFPMEDETDTLGPVHQLASQADAFIWSTDAVEGGPPGLVLDLTSFIEADGEPAEADFLLGLWDHFQWQGSTWGLPAGVDPLVVLYDQIAFEEAGLEPPAPGWTWDDLFDTAQQLTKREGKRIVRYGFADFGLGSMRSAVEAQGGRLVDDSADPPVPTLDDSSTIAAVQWYADLALTHKVMANPTEKEFVDSFGLVQSGEAAMSVTLGRFWVDGGRDEELGVAPLPGRSPVWLRGYFVSAGAAHPEEAWRWLRFLSREVAPPDHLPARRSSIPDSAYAVVAGEEALGAFRYAAEHVLPPLHPAVVEELLRQAAERVFEGEEVEDVLVEAQAQALSLSVSEAAEPLSVPSPVPTQKSVHTITFVAFDRRPYKPLVEAFHESYPKVEVVVREASDFDYRGRQPMEMIEVSGADCFVAADLAMSSSEIQQVVLNLQPFIDADPTFPLDDYEPGALEAVRYGGNLWGLPAGVSMDVLWYNRTLFDEAGLSYPEADWSWDDVFLTARELSGGKGHNQRYGFVIWPDVKGVLLPKTVDLLESVGGPLVSEDAIPPTFRFDAPEVVATARRLADLTQDEIIPTSYHQVPFERLIKANQVGMWIGDATWWAWMTWDKNFDVHPAPLPQPGRCFTSLRSLTYYVTANTPHAESCWKWLSFLSEHLLPGTKFLPFLPPRRSLLTSSTFREQVGTDAQTVYLEALECEEWGGLRRLDNLPPYSDKAIPWLDQALEEILWEGADAQATLSEAQRKAEAYLECLRQQADPEDEASAEVCFQQVDAQ